MRITSRSAPRVGAAVLLIASLPALASSVGSAAASHRVAAVAASRSGAAAAPSPALTVTPTKDLVDDQNVSFYATATVPDSTFVFAECGPEALSIFTGNLPPEDNPNDGCEQQRDAIVFSDAAGVVAGSMRLKTVLTTAVGSDDCRTRGCFVALFSLSGTEGPLLSNLSFSRSACAAPGSCTVTRTRPTVSASTDAVAHVVTPRTGTPIGTATPGTPVAFAVSAGPAGDLSSGAAVTGPDVPLGGNPAPVVPESGEGLVQLELAGPGTSWDSVSAPSVVVDVAVDGGTPQQMVLYRGATPFVYAGFTGPTTTGAHTVSVKVDTGLSPAAVPSAQVIAGLMSVVTPSNPAYLAYAYAPVMYGRSTSARHDTPLVTYAESQALGGGATRLSYTVTWSHEDAGTGFVPFLEWAEWGRITDIENAMSFTVQSDGSVTDATYLWGGQPDDYPDSQGAVSETDVPFAGSFDGHHPIIRDATGNNDFSDHGTTAFRFQMAIVPPPAAGQTREGVMDANPWTYEVMGQEVNRWYENGSTDTRSAQPGDARQYAILQYTTSGSGVTSVGYDVQLSGSPTWYENDLGSGYKLAGTGTGRTVIKLPAGWQGRSITGLRLRVFPASAAPSVHLTSLELQYLQPDWTLSSKAFPAAQVVGATPTVPVALRLATGFAADTAAGPGRAGTISAGSRSAAAGGAVEPFQAVVFDSLDQGLQGVGVGFSAPSTGPTATFDGCSCPGALVLSGAGGIVSSGAATAGSSPGTASVVAKTVDPLTDSLTYLLTITAATGGPVGPATPATPVESGGTNFTG